MPGKELHLPSISAWELAKRFEEFRQNFFQYHTHHFYGCFFDAGIAPAQLKPAGMNLPFFRFAKSGLLSEHSRYGAFQEIQAIPTARSCRNPVSYSGAGNYMIIHLPYSCLCAGSLTPFSMPGAIYFLSSLPALKAFANGSPMP